MPRERKYRVKLSDEQVKRLKNVMRDKATTLTVRIADIETLKRELSCWESDRNSADSKIVWQFQTKDARVKLASLYPKIVEC